MAVRFACPGCDKPLKVDDQFGGRTVACPACRTPMIVPPAPAVVVANGRREPAGHSPRVMPPAPASTSRLTRAARRPAPEADFEVVDDAPPRPAVAKRAAKPAADYEVIEDEVPPPRKPRRRLDEEAGDRPARRRRPADENKPRRPGKRPAERKGVNWVSVGIGLAVIAVGVGLFLLSDRTRGMVRGGIAVVIGVLGLCGGFLGYGYNSDPQEDDTDDGD